MYEMKDEIHILITSLSKIFAKEEGLGKKFTKAFDSIEL